MAVPDWRYCVKIFSILIGSAFISICIYNRYSEGRILSGMPYQTFLAIKPFTDDNGNTNTFNVGYPGFKKKLEIYSEKETLENQEYIADWKTVVNDILYVYSAHLDPRDGPATVKIFGGMHTDHMTDTVTCQLLTGQFMSEAVIAEVIQMDKMGAVYPDVDIHCLFSGDPWSFPDDTRIMISMDNSTNAILKVEQTFKKQEDRQFTVCMWSALYTNNSGWLVEWLEANFMFGADLIYIYKSGKFIFDVNVDQVLQNYVDKGLVKVLPWHSPKLTGVGRLSHINFQMTMIADCHHRNINQTKYLVASDFDELIVPRGPRTNTWQQMIENSGCQPNSSFGARHMLFVANEKSKLDPRCANLTPCFSKSCNLTAVNTKRDASSMFLRTMCVTERATAVFNLPARAKFIALLSSCTRLAVHHPGRLPYGHLCAMNITVGSLHHYRNRGVSWTNKTDDVVHDTTMHKFWTQLSKRII